MRGIHEDNSCCESRLSRVAFRVLISPFMQAPPLSNSLVPPSSPGAARRWSQGVAPPPGPPASFPQAVRCSPVPSWPGSFPSLTSSGGHGEDTFILSGVSGGSRRPTPCFRKSLGSSEPGSCLPTPWPCWRKQVSLQKKKTKKIKHPLCERQENRTWKASHRVNMTAWVPNAWQPLLSGEQWLVAGILAVSQLLTSAGNCVPTPHPPRDLGTPLASSYFLPSSQRLREVSPPVSVCVCHLSPPPSAPLKCKTHH